MLCNVSYSDLPVGFDDKLYSYVHDFGGGLFTICGNEADENPNDEEWTANAYTREDMFVNNTPTLYQQMLPVEVINYTPPTAVMIVIDRSGSMTTDTNNFSNSTYPSTLEMASALLSAGVDRDRIISELYNRQRENRLRLMGHALTDLMKITDDGVAYMVFDAETLKRYDIREGETEGFVNMPLTIDTVRMSLLLKEDGERVRVSIRSKKGTSANMCARLYFNGGGHENAAGGRLILNKDLSDISEAGTYIEKYTHKFLTDNK